MIEDLIIDIEHENCLEWYSEYYDFKVEEEAILWIKTNFYDRSVVLLNVYDELIEVVDINPLNYGNKILMITKI